MKRKIELLAPGGDLDSIKAAIAAGADAIYCGLNRFNARNRAENICIEDLNGIVRLAHRNDCEVFLTLNIIIVQAEIPALLGLLDKVSKTRIDGIIIQDLGLFYLINAKYKNLKIHASTQLTTHNEGQIKFLSELTATRVNLSRELNLHEIKALAATGHENGILSEVFVHGSNCISFSGLCYISSVHGGNSGNRGRCSQPCRKQYLTTPEGRCFPLNLKDNSAYFDLREIAEAGVDSVKIEGRIKKFHYVYTVVKSWKKQLQGFYENNRLSDDNSVLHKVFNRDFSNSFLVGNIHKNMFIDNPRDNSAIHLAENYGCSSNENIEKAKKELYDEKTAIIEHVKNKIGKLNIEKAPVEIAVSGEAGTLLKISVKTPDTSFVLLSKTPLKHSVTNNLEPKNRPIAANRLDYDSIFISFKALNETEYFIKHLEVMHLQGDLFLPFKELTSLKKRLLFILNGSQETFTPLDIPDFQKQGRTDINPTLSVLISSPDDVYLCKETSSDIYFQLPNSFQNGSPDYLKLFKENKTLLPWFPSVLIGEDYRTAVDILLQIQPECIVTNNSGIAYEASKNGISWIAGPYLNTVNSYSLLCLKEKFNCSGAFISNELNQYQIKCVKKPENFDIYYSIYHPILLLTSRQCLFHQVIGCEKDRIDEECIQNCSQYSAITNLNNIPLIIEKSKGNYHCIYNNYNFLNTDILTDLPGKFSSFLVDLRSVETKTHEKIDKSSMIDLFQNLLDGDPGSKEKLNQTIFPTTHTQYIKGI